MEAIPSKGTREVDDASDFGDIGALGDLFYEARRANLCKPRPCLHAVHCAARLIRTLMMTTLRASRGTIFSLDVLRFIADSNTGRLAEEVKP